MKPDPKRQSRWYFGGLASAGAACVTHPLDLLKVHLQTGSGVAVPANNLGAKTGGGVNLIGHVAKVMEHNDVALLSCFDICSIRLHCSYKDLIQMQYLFQYIDYTVRRTSCSLQRIVSISSQAIDLLYYQICNL